MKGGQQGTRMIDDIAMTLGKEEFAKVHAKRNKYKSKTDNIKAK